MVDEKKPPQSTAIHYLAGENQGVDSPLSSQGRDIGDGVEGASAYRQAGTQAGQVPNRPRPNPEAVNPGISFHHGPLFQTDLLPVPGFGWEDSDRGRAGIVEQELELRAEDRPNVPSKDRGAGGSHAGYAFDTGGLPASTKSEGPFHAARTRVG